jgi:type IV secretory pathway protease TraF
MMRRLVVLLSGVVALACLVLWWQGSFVVHNIGTSMPARRYLCTPLQTPADLQLDHVVLFTWPEAIQDLLHQIAPFVETTLPCLKRIAGLVGDRVCWEAAGLTVNAGVPYGLPLLERYPIPPRQGCHVVQATEVFLLGQDPRSFDSRYIGSLPLASLAATCMALW